MAIDLVCYTTINASTLNERIADMKSRYSDVFDKSYIMYNAYPVLNRTELALLKSRAQQYHLETRLLIAEEFGLENARSYFTVAVNDKSFPVYSTSAMADLLRKELGHNNIIILHNGDVRI